VLLLSPCHLVTLSPCHARADGGTVRLSKRQGGYRITVFTEPTPFRAGPVDISVLVQDARTGEPDAQVRVAVRVAPRGRPGESILHPATSESATNKLFRAAVFEIPEPGWWEIEVTVEGGRARARVWFELDAAEAIPKWLDLWPWLGWPALALSLFAIHQLLVLRKERAKRAPRVGCGATPGSRQPHCRASRVESVLPGGRSPSVDVLSDKSVNP